VRAASRGCTEHCQRTNERLVALEEHAQPIGVRTELLPRDEERVLPAGLDENGSASFAEDVSACLHADAKRRRLMTAVTDRRAPKCFL
jgi:hypothetical protein